MGEAVVEEKAEELEKVKIEDKEVRQPRVARVLFRRPPRLNGILICCSTHIIAAGARFAYRAKLTAVIM